MSLAPVALSAQTVSVSGRVLRGGRDTVPLANAWVVLHRVTREGGGPLDSVRTDLRGRYRIQLRVEDTTGVYVVSAWYDSLAYFSLPLNVVGRPAVHVEDLVAYPTTVNQPPIRLARRLITIANPGQDGMREVLEILELENMGHTTRITKDTLVPTWAGRVPEVAGQFQGGQGDISPEAIVFRNDSVLVLGPIPPGPPKQLSYGYSLPASARKLVLTIDQHTVELNLLVEDTVSVVTAPPPASNLWACRKSSSGASRHIARGRSRPATRSRSRCRAAPSARRWCSPTSSPSSPWRWSRPSCGPCGSDPRQPRLSQQFNSRTGIRKPV